MANHKITLTIRLLRRLLLFGLVALCAILLYREIQERPYNKKSDSDSESTQLKLRTAQWGVPVERLARETDLPIFFSINDTFREEAQNSDLIKKYYIYTELDPQLYPADYHALKALHCNAKDNVQITCGVLTSKMYPILTSANTHFNSNESFPSIKSTLWGIINLYHENYTKFLKLSQNFYLLNDIPSKYHMQELKEDMSKLTFMLDFGLHKNFKAAQLSESARLTFRNCTVDKYSTFRTKIKLIAYQEILEKLRSPKDLNFRERAFYARALADFILIFDETESVQLLKDFAQEIIDSQDKDGAFLIDKDKDSLKNALSLTILSYTYKITGDEKYLKAIESFSQFLETHLNKQHALSADFEKGGVAGAKGYVYLSRALLNAYLVSFNPKCLNLVKQTLLRLHAYHKKLNSMALELPQESSLAKYINLCSVEDDSYTSTNGVLLQVYSDMFTLKLLKDADVKIDEILDSTLNSNLKDIDFDFSLRLAKYPNPLINIDTLVKLELAKGNNAIKDK